MKSKIGLLAVYAVIILFFIYTAVHELQAKGLEQAVTTNQTSFSVLQPSQITFTPVTTIYLPIAHHIGCSTAPRLIAPADQSRLNTLIPLFQLDVGSNPLATELVLGVSRYSDFRNYTSLVYYRLSTYGIIGYRFSFNFDPDTTYYWRAWLMCGQRQGPYSEAWSFTTGSGGVILGAPQLISPISGTVFSTTTVTLQWSSVNGAVGYVLRLQPAGSSTTYIYTGLTGTQIRLRVPIANSMYEWRVAARNDYAYGEYSEQWRFTTQTALQSNSILPSEHQRLIAGDRNSIILADEDKIVEETE